jgi:hypothetical protein
MFVGFGGFIQISLPKQAEIQITAALNAGRVQSLDGQVSAQHR